VCNVNYKGSSYLANVSLVSALSINGEKSDGEAVYHVEDCDCPVGYMGQFCDFCSPGFHRDPPGGSALASCVPCNCNGHSDMCDVNTGKSIGLLPKRNLTLSINKK